MQEVQRGTQQAARSFADFRSVALAAVSALGVRELAAAANEFANINNQLRTIVNEEEDLAVVSDEVLRIASETGTAYASQAQLVARIGRANENIGASGAEILRVSEAVSQSFALAGASAQETAAASIQLGQALSSGRLQGDELRSILENNAVLARTIAAEFGVSVGELRELASTGAVTSDRVFAAILNDADNLNDRFAEFAPTLERGGVAIRNSFVNAVGEIDQALGTSKAFARSLQDAAAIIDTDLVPSLVEGVSEFSTFVSVTFARLALLGTGIDQIAARAAGSIAEARDETDFLDDAISAVGESAGAFAGQFDVLWPGLEEGVRVLVSPLQLVADGLASVNEATEDVTAASQALTDAQREEATLLDTIEALENDAAERRAQRARQREEQAARLANLDLGGDAVDQTNALSEAQEDAAESAEELLAALEAENAELAANAIFGDEANNVLQRREVLEAAAADGAEQFADALREQLALLEQNRAAAEAAENARDDAEVISGLEFELELLSLTNRERAIAVELQNLSATATDEQRQRVEELAGALSDAEDESADLATFFSETLAEQTAIGVRGALSSVFEGEFDSIRDDFGQLLSDLGQELLTSLFLQLISDQFANLAGPGGGGIFGALSQAFGGNRQFGGNTSGGLPFIVNEKQGGEVFVPPPGGGRIFPDAQGAGLSGGAPQVNVSVISTTAAGVDALEAQETAAGREVARANVSQDREFYQELFGV